MLNTTESPICQPLEDSLVLRTATSQHDADRVAEFNATIHGPGVGVMTRDLILGHPHTSGRDLVFVEDTSTGRVVSSLFLIPWTWRVDGAEIRSAEMGIVGTLEPYRRRGLIRRQVAWFNQRLRERGCALSHIQGIPYYYRQFGYQYALPLEGGYRLEHRDAPQPESSGASFTFRRAGEDDAPALMALYDDAARDLAIHALRDGAVWQYLLHESSGSEMQTDTWLIFAGDGQPAGYYRAPHHHFGAEFTVNETSRLSFECAVAALDHIKSLSVAQGAPGIRLCLPASTTLMRLAKACGAHDRGTYQWQIMIPDTAGLLRALGPALEMRLAHSPFAGLTRNVLLDFYRDRVTLRFERGRLVEVAGAASGTEGGYRFPPQAFIPLVLGHRSLQEQRETYPDIGVWGHGSMLIETLFPKISAFLFTIY